MSSQIDDPSDADQAASLHLFEAFGVELEYMIVEAESLNVCTIADKVLMAAAGCDDPIDEVELGEIAWSNELALHVLELKTNRPAAGLASLAQHFQDNITRVNEILAPHQARLMPTAMHPWMDSLTEMKLWPHVHNPVYEAYNRIFDCRGHGWANLQSVHLNLPFTGDQEFGLLHAAIRLLLPILPAIAASSPIADSACTGMADYRLNVYRNNSKRVPAVTGAVVPEAVFTQHDYEQGILQPLYRDIAPLDPDGILQHEWLNARGAIARFDRDAIEIRVLDIQECPAADLAICQAIHTVLQAMIDNRWSDAPSREAFDENLLADILLATSVDAEKTVIDNARYLQQFGFPESRATAGELWSHLREQFSGPQAFAPEIAAILKSGTLATRIVNAFQNDPSRLAEIYRELCDCLAAGKMFRVES